MHGGDIYSYMELNGGKEPVDLSSNINPYGTPEQVKGAMYEALGQCGSYPDPLCRSARKAIGESEGVDPGHIYCGAGAADIIYRLTSVIKPKNALIPVPCFMEYERSLTGCLINFHRLREDEGFILTERVLDEFNEKTDIIFLCNPNNPTGVSIEPELLTEIERHCKENRIWLILDECFLDFLRDAENRTLKLQIEDDPYLVILRSYTKMYAIPGLRLGWCMSSSEKLINALYRAGQPWNVSVIAQRAAEAASKEKAFAKVSAEKIMRERRNLGTGLIAHGMKVFPGEANFLLFRSERDDLRERLLERGILIRDCSNFRGLGKGYYRTAVKTRTETEVLLSALSEIREERSASCDF